jgi:hypothetical protein
MQELSGSQSSLFAQADEIGATIGGGSGTSGRDSIGRGVVSANGGGVLLMGDAMGFMGNVSNNMFSLVKGGAITYGRSVAKAEHLTVGFPVVPGGQTHNGL